MGPQCLSWGYNQNVSWGWGLIWKLKWVKICFQVHGDVGRIWLFVGCWTSDLSSLLVFIWKPHSVLHHMSLHAAAQVWQSVSTKPEGWKSTRKKEARVLCNLFMEVTSNHLLCSVGQDQVTQGDEVIQRKKDVTRSWGFLEGILGSMPYRGHQLEVDEWMVEEFE